MASKTGWVTVGVLLAFSCSSDDKRKDDVAGRQEPARPEGRRLMKAKKSKEAIAAFREAIAAQYDSAIAYSELSWAAFTSGDLSTAKEAASKSIGFGDDLPIVQAMSYYNLGRAKEEEGDRPGAIDAYQASFRLRQHPAVRKRLEALSAEVPVSVWTAKPLAGPFATLDDYCATLKLPASSQHEARSYCEREVDPLEQKVEGLGWAGRVGTIESYDDDDTEQYLPQVNLVFETAKGWYVLPSFDMRGNRYSWNITRTQLVGSRLALYHENEEGRFESQVYRLITVCGVGASGAPSCYGPTTLFDSFTGYEGGKEDGQSLPEEISFDCEATFVEGDKLVIAAKDGGCRRMAGIVGEHRVQFP